MNYTQAGGPSFGVVVRSTDGAGGYVCGVGKAPQPEHYFLAPGTVHNTIDHDLKRQLATVDQQWHTYRVDVRDNHITMSGDGSFIATITDSTYLNSNQVGLYASAAVINVKISLYFPDISLDNLYSYRFCSILETRMVHGID